MPRVEKRTDRTDGVAYTKKQFAEHYGEKKGNKIWEAAGVRADPTAKAKVSAKDGKPRKAKDEFLGTLKFVGNHMAMICCDETMEKYQRDVTIAKESVPEGALHLDQVAFKCEGDRFGLPQCTSARLLKATPKAKEPRESKVKAEPAAKGKKGPPKIKLTYFGIEGAAEKVRLALVLGKVEFEDDRIDRKAWEVMKPTTKFGQLPLMSIDGGEPLAQSGAMLRYAGKLGGLYPTHPAVVQTIEEVIGLQEDVARAMAPGLYVGMKPQIYGYPADMPEAERKQIQERLRKTLVEGELPKMLGYLDAMLEKNGTGWFVGKKPTIADCQVIPMLRTMKKGVQDHIPTTLFDNLTHLKKFYEAFHEIPEVKTYYGGKGAP